MYSHIQMQTELGNYCMAFWNVGKGMDWMNGMGQSESVNVWEKRENYRSCECPDE